MTDKQTTLKETLVSKNRPSTEKALDAAVPYIVASALGWRMALANLVATNRISQELADEVTSNAIYLTRRLVVGGDYNGASINNEIGQMMRGRIFEQLVDIANDTKELENV